MRAVIYPKRNKKLSARSIPPLNSRGQSLEEILQTLSLLLLLLLSKYEYFQYDYFSNSLMK